MGYKARWLGSKPYGLHHCAKCFPYHLHCGSKSLIFVSIKQLTHAGNICSKGGEPSPCFWESPNVSKASPGKALSSCLLSSQTAWDGRSQADVWKHGARMPSFQSIRPILALRAWMLRIFSLELAQSCPRNGSSSSSSNLENTSTFLHPSGLLR